MKTRECQHQFSKKLLSKANFLVRQLGSYHFKNYLDARLFDINEIISEYRELPQDERVIVAKELQDYEYACQLLSNILNNMGRSISDAHLKEIVLSGHVSIQNEYNFSDDEVEEYVNVSDFEDYKAKKEREKISPAPPMRIYKI